MGKSIEELALKEEVLPTVAPTEIPEEFSSAPLPPYPGLYWWKLPADLATIWADPFDIKVDENGIADREGTKTSQRIAAAFEGEHALKILHAEHGEHIGESFSTRISNAERNRARKNQPPIHIPDMTYLLIALGDPNPSPGSNAAFAKALMQHGGEQFKANLEWTAGCNSERQVYYEQADEGGNPTLQPGCEEDGVTPINGCGNRYYMNDWPKDPTSGRYLERRICSCGASLRPFGQLRNFGPTS